MWPFPQMLLKWDEPKAFSVIQHKVMLSKIPWWHHLVPFGSFLAVVIALLLVHRGQPVQGDILFWVMVGFSFLGFVILPYSCVWLAKSMAVRIIIWSNGIGRYTFAGDWVRTYEKLQSFSINSCGSYHVLEIMTQRGESRLIGIPPELDLVQIEYLLTEHGLQKRFN